MKYLLNNNERLTFIFERSYVTCYNYDYGYYQTNNGILSFAILDLVFKIIEQQKRERIILKKRKPIIHLLNYVDILNSSFSTKKFGIDFRLENRYKEQLLYNLYLYRRTLYYKDSYRDSLEIIEYKNSCVIGLEYDCYSQIQPKNSNLTAMLMYILEKKKINMIDGDGIIFYCVFLM